MVAAAPPVTQPHVEATPFGNAIVEGFILDHEPVSKLGYNPDVDADVEDVWIVGGLYVFPTVKQQMEVISSSANDTSDGTGARTVKIYYLDDTFTEKDTTVTLNGTTAVATTPTDIYRINRFEVATAGTGGVAAGNIDIRNVADTPIYSRIGTGQTADRDLIYTVPKGKIMYIVQVTYSAGASSGTPFGRFTLRSTYNNQMGVVSTLFYPLSEIGVQNGAFTIAYVIPMKFPPRIRHQSSRPVRFRRVEHAGLMPVQGIC
jgi:hypothetical protein